mgnify:CR=1 FL=1
MIEFVKQNPTLVQGIAAVTAGIAAAATAALALSAALTLLSANPIVLAIGGAGALALLAAFKLGAFEGLAPNIPSAVGPGAAGAAMATVRSGGDAGQWQDQNSILDRIERNTRDGGLRIGAG